MEVGGHCPALAIAHGGIRELHYRVVHGLRFIIIKGVRCLKVAG